MIKKSSHTPNIAHQINLARQSLDNTPAWIRGDGVNAASKHSNSESSSNTAPSSKRTVRASAK